MADFPQSEFGFDFFLPRLKDNSLHLQVPLASKELGGWYCCVGTDPSRLEFLRPVTGGGLRQSSAVVPNAGPGGAARLPATLHAGPGGAANAGQPGQHTDPQNIQMIAASCQHILCVVPTARPRHGGRGSPNLNPNRQQPKQVEGRVARRDVSDYKHECRVGSVRPGASGVPHSPQPAKLGSPPSAARVSPTESTNI